MLVALELALRQVGVLHHGLDRTFLLLACKVVAAVQHRDYWLDDLQELVFVGVESQHNHLIHQYQHLVEEEVEVRLVSPQFSIEAVQELDSIVLEQLQLGVYLGSGCGYLDLGLLVAGVYNI